MLAIAAMALEHGGVLDHVLDIHGRHFFQTQ
jgi:hypothetical protein